MAETPPAKVGDSDSIPGPGGSHLTRPLHQTPEALSVPWSPWSAVGEPPVRNLSTATGE